MKKFHHVVARRYHRDGVLKLDNSEDVAGQSQGSLKSLDLQEDAFVGFVPTEHKKYDLTTIGKFPVSTMKFIIASTMISI